MRELGHVEGRSYALVERYAEGDMARAEALLREQLVQGVNVFLTPGAAAVRLVLRDTKAVPIVSVGLHPRGGQTDLFASLARPGGMVTGVSNFGEELAAKRVQLLKRGGAQAGQRGCAAQHHRPGVPALGRRNRSSRSARKAWPPCGWG